MRVHCCRIAAKYMPPRVQLDRSQQWLRTNPFAFGNIGRSETGDKNISHTSLFLDENDSVVLNFMEILVHLPCILTELFLIPNLKAGDTWYDGPCRLCICTNQTSKGICQPVICEEPAERGNYVLKPFYLYGDCCPTYKPVACKMNGIVYEVIRLYLITTVLFKSLPRLTELITMFPDEQFVDCRRWAVQNNAMWWEPQYRGTFAERNRQNLPYRLRIC